jgi:hypothetical protein
MMLHTGKASGVPRLEPTYLSEMSVVYVGYDVEKQPVDLLDDLIEVWWEVVAVLSTGKKRKLAYTCTYCH